MKRKLRIFSNIAIICLSVCMFAFGVYAASTVSVTTSGTVTFTAKNVTASITRKLEGINTTKSTFLKDAGSEDTYTLPVNTETAPEGATATIDTLKEESLVFENYATPIVMTFTITNLSTDSNIDVTPPEALATSGNVITAVDVFEPAYVGNKVNVNPSGISGDSLVIKIYFYVKDANASANLSYNFTIGLANQEKFENSATVTGATQTKVGNTYLFATSLATNNTHFEKFELTGANCYDYMPYISGTDCIVPVHAYGTNAITYSATTGSNTSNQFEFWESNNFDKGFQFITNKSYTGISTFIVPIAANSNGDVDVVVEFDEMGVSGRVSSSGNSITSIIMPNTILQIGSSVFGMSYFPNLQIDSLPRYLVNIQHEAFAGKKVTINSLPNTLTYLGQGAFFTCESITEISVPRSITTIDGMSLGTVFNGTESLTRINYLGTKAQLESMIELKLFAADLPNARVYFIDGTSVVPPEIWWE